MTIAAVLLAAGLSTRFGAGDKVSAPLDGIPLGFHAANTIRRLPLAHRFVVTGSQGLDWSGFEIVPNDRPEVGLSHSIALGVAAARKAGAEAILLALADMPFVSVPHFAKLIESHSGPTAFTASSDGKRRMPPALFGADWFSQLEALTGDKGARDLLAHAKTLLAAPNDLIDVDRQEHLAAAAYRLEHQTSGTNSW